MTPEVRAWVQQNVRRVSCQFCPPDTVTAVYQKRHPDQSARSVGVPLSIDALRHMARVHIVQVLAAAIADEVLLVETPAHDGTGVPNYHGEVGVVLRGEGCIEGRADRSAPQNLDQLVAGPQPAEFVPEGGAQEGPQRERPKSREDLAREEIDWRQKYGNRKRRK